MPAADSFFVDTNVLLYGVASRNLRKQHAARLWLEALWATGTGRLSWQVLHEFYANAGSKMKLPQDAARRQVLQFAEWAPAGPSLQSLSRAWHWIDSAQVSLWDGLILAAAEQLECRWLLSEDFQSGRNYAGVTVVNPFLALPEQYGLAPTIARPS